MWEKREGKGGGEQQSSYAGYSCKRGGDKILVNYQGGRLRRGKGGGSVTAGGPTRIQRKKNNRAFF